MSNAPTLPNADLPSLASDYFGQPQEQVQLVQVFSPVTGWRTVEPQPASWDAVFAFADRMGERTSYAFKLGNSVADFSFLELQKWARRPFYARPAYPARQPV